MSRCEENVLRSRVKDLERRVRLLEGRAVKGGLLPDRKVIERAVFHLEQQAETLKNTHVCRFSDWESTAEAREAKVEFDECRMLAKRLRKMVKA